MGFQDRGEKSPLSELDLAKEAIDKANLYYFPIQNFLKIFSIIS